MHTKWTPRGCAQTPPSGPTYPSPLPVLWELVLEGLQMCLSWESPSAAGSCPAHGYTSSRDSPQPVTGGCGDLRQHTLLLKCGTILKGCLSSKASCGLSCNHTACQLHALSIPALSTCFYLALLPTPQRSRPAHNSSWPLSMEIITSLWSFLIMWRNSSRLHADRFILAF